MIKLKLCKSVAKLNVRRRAGILPAGGQDVRATDLHNNSTDRLPTTTVKNTIAVEKENRQYD